MIIDAKLTYEQISVMESVANANILQIKVNAKYELTLESVKKNDGKDWAPLERRIKGMHKDLFEALALLSWSLARIDEDNLDVTPLKLTREDINKCAMGIFQSIGLIEYRLLTTRRKLRVLEKANNPEADEDDED